MKLNFALLPILFFFGALYFVNSQTDGQVVKDFKAVADKIENVTKGDVTQ